MKSRWRVASVVVATLMLSGCAVVPKWARLWEPRPRLDVKPIKLQADAGAAVRPQDRAYTAAKTAIERRDYASALDMLQLAREEAPDDPRVLNALGVVYDKLGRFDLSARYYQRALTQEPNSPIVETNVAYSDRLQRATQASARALASAPLAPTPKAPQMAERPINKVPAVAPFRLASSKVAPKVSANLIGKPLLLVNAAGRPGAQEPVRRYLADAGWSVRTQLQIRPSQARTEIRFPAVHRNVAEALARTLPFNVVLAECANTCSDLELVVGADAPQAKARS